MFYSVCLSAVYGGTPLPDAIRLAREAGADACEFWMWEGQDIDAIADALRETGMNLTAICTSRFVLNDPAQRDEYVEGIKASVQVAKRLNCPALITQVGQTIPDMSRKAQHASIVEGLRACAPILEESGVKLLVEPLNTLVDHIGYYLGSSEEGAEIVREAGSPNIFMLYDIYHMQIMEGNLISNLMKHKGIYAHLHAACVPGRNELLNLNEINYADVFKALKAIGYDGPIGLEYVPTKDPSEGLKELFEKMPL